MNNMIHSNDTLTKQQTNSEKNKLKYSIGLKNALIVGVNSGSVDIYDKIKSYPALGYKVHGFIALREIENKNLSKQLPILGGLNTLKKYIETYNVDIVLIAIDPDQKEHLETIIKICNVNKIAYQIVHDVYNTVYGHVIRDVYQDIFQYKEFNIRRVLDFFGAIFLIVLLIPLYIVVSVTIKLESKGAVLYSQLRTGKNKKPFRIYKFRSMVQDAEKLSGPVWAQKSDPRITRVGYIMRKTRIDELPQLINILKGDMSFIGPRPERPFFVESFKQQIPFYLNRLQVKPGVTGWAQVKWRYDETIEDVKEKLSYDLYYINNRSLWMDLKILLFTVKTVVLGKGQ